MSTEPWWKSAVVYQIYPRSFADTNGDGVGDLAGVRAHLEHLVWLGVDAIWLSPFYRSPMADFGYDVADHCDVDPVFGTLDDFDALVADAHASGIKVIVDWVPNHTSDHHRWFVESRQGRTSAKRDWYVWRDPAPDGGPPNNWVAAFAPEPAWTYDEASGQYYLHCFLPEQPDLDWSNPEVEAAMHDVLRFWLDRGVDGFRMDVTHLIGKDPELADDPPEYLPIPHSALNDRPETHPLLRRIRTLLDAYPGDRMIVGEVYLLDTALVAPYYGDDDELHLSFNFPPLFTPWDATQWRAQIDKTVAELEPLSAWPTWVLSNHDNPRHRTRYDGDEGRARAAAVLLLGLRGTPFLYAGEELGLLDAEVPADRVVDPGGRDGCRAPIPWEPTLGHGWPGEPWLPFAPEAQTRSVADEKADPHSILHLYRRLLAARRGSEALQLGAQHMLAAPEGVVAWTRQTPAGDRRVVVVNFTDAVVRLEGTEALAASAHTTIEVASDGLGEGAAFTGALAPDQAVVLRPG
ncbi:alpha-amylase [Rhabdothermincola sp. EGI L10124]|nr:alpha-amylase [Rhabdothermincola salaria]